MRLLLCVDTEKNIDHLSKRLSRILNMLEEDLYYIDLLHVYAKPQADAPHLPYTVSAIQEDEQRVRVQFMAKIQNQIDELLSDKLHKTALVNSFLVVGNFYQEFKMQLSKYQYDLIVLIPDKKDTLDLFFNGANVTKITEYSDVPVLVLPKNDMCLYDDLDLVALVDEDYKDEIERINNLGITKKLKEGELSFVHISKEPKEIEQVINLTGADKFSIFHNYHISRKRDHVYILNHKRKKGLRKLLEGSFTKAIFSEHDCSIMII